MGWAERAFELRLTSGEARVQRLSSAGKERRSELVSERESGLRRSPFSGGFSKRVPATAFLRRFVA